MMKNFFVYIFILITIVACRKKEVKEELINPPIIEVINAELLSFSPQFPVAGKPITIILDAAKGNKGLQGINEIFIHTGVITDKSTSGSDWKYLAYNDFTKPHEPSKMLSLGNNKFSITFVPKELYKVPSGEKILKLAMVFRNADGSKVARNTNGSDMYLPIYEENKLHVSFTNPQLEPLFEPQPVLQIKQVGEQLSVTGIASKKANLSLLLNGQSFAEQQNTDKITATASIKIVGEQEITIKAINGSETAESTW
jgi:1,4-alpha-glucan branching enzyme